MATIRLFNKADPSKGWIVESTVNGKRTRRFVKTEAEAKAALETTSTDNVAATAIFEQKNEVLHALDRCKKMNTTITDVVDFYEKHCANKSNPAVEKVVQSLLAERRQAGCKNSYLETLNRHFSKLVAHVGASTPLGDITTDQIREFVYLSHSHVNEVTKLNLIRNLSVLFNYGINQNLIGINPMGKKLAKPKAKFKVPAVMSPADFNTLLHRCYRKGWYDRLTIFVLIGFCGVRTEEASNLTWADISYDEKRVLVPADVAKKMGFRRNNIPPNAMAWLEAVRDNRRTGPIIGSNFVNLLRSAVRFAHIKHTKNCIRHSFCSYALEAGWSLEDVIAYMGHNGSPAMVATHYRNVVSKADADAWWAIVPPTA